MKTIKEALKSIKNAISESISSEKADYIGPESVGYERMEEPSDLETAKNKQTKLDLDSLALGATSQGEPKSPSPEREASTSNRSIITEVRNRIKVAKLKLYRPAGMNIVNLNLSNLNLSSRDIEYVLSIVSKEIPDITDLDLSKNHLGHLPASINDLTKLIRLNLSDNQLTTLPASIKDLTQLIHLNLADNQLRTLPATIGWLTNLRSLTLTSNHLATLPAETGSLENLISLVLSNNQLTILPSTIGRLANLRLLDLDGNKLTNLPMILRNFASRETRITLRNNPLSLESVSWFNIHLPNCKAVKYKKTKSDLTNLAIAPRSPREQKSPSPEAEANTSNRNSAKQKM